MNSKVYDGVVAHLSAIHCDSFKLLEVERGYVKISMNINESNHNMYGFAHGGALYTLCDTASGACIYSLGYNNVTLQGGINYMKSANDGEIYVECRVHHYGRKTAVTNAVVKNSDGEELCLATFTMYLKGEVVEGDE